MKKKLFISILAFSIFFTGCMPRSTETNETLSETVSDTEQTISSSENTSDIEHTNISSEELNEDTETQAPIPCSSVDPEKPMVAITFDDGPSANTNRILDIFAKHEVKGTFFVIGNRLDDHRETLKRIAEEGHEIASHGWDHRQLTKLTNEDIVYQIETTREKIYDITGTYAAILRPSYGSVNNEVIQVCKDNEVIVVKWSIDPHDWKYKDVSTIYDIIMANLDDGDIILCHDIYRTTADAMEAVIPALKEKGYQLVTVSELLSFSDHEITAGGVYSHKYN